jgi:hypothetical protein
MKIRHELPLLILAGMFLLANAVAPHCAAQVTFVQSPRSDQETLPPEKKRSLPGLGPDELFTEQESGRPSRSDSKTRRAASRPRSANAPTPTPSPSPTATPSPSPLPTATPSPTAATPSPIAATPSPAALVSTIPSVGPPPPPASIGWQLAALGALTVLVAGALLYVLIRLRELLSEGSA